MNEQALYLKMEAMRRRLFREKHEYYSSEYNLDIKPNHITWYIEADKEYSKILFQVDVQKTIVNYLERIVKRVSDQNYIIRNIQEWERFKGGA
jgi:hypothetical protein